VSSLHTPLSRTIVTSPPHSIATKLKPKPKPKMALKLQLAIDRACEAVEALNHEEAEVV
jgi:hypothetical protein